MKLKDTKNEILPNKNAADHNDATFGVDAPTFNPTVQLKQNPINNFFGQESFGKEKNVAEKISETTQPFQLKKNASTRSAQNNSSSSRTTLPENVQRKMESSFNTDFSNVNIHSGSEKASSMGAQAFAQGNDIHFAPGKYNPQSQSGQELIGHELTHVTQQREGRVQPTAQFKGNNLNTDSSLENEADKMGKNAAKGLQVNQPSKAQVSSNQSTDAPIQGFGLKNAVDWAKDKASGAAEWVGDKAEDATEWATDKAEGVADWAGDKAEGAVDWAKDKADEGKGFLEKGKNKLVNAGKSLFGKAKNWVSSGLEWVTNTGSSIWKAIKSKVVAVKERLTGGAKNLINFLLNIGGAVKDKITQFIEKIKNSGESLWNELKSNLHILSLYFKRIVTPDEEILGSFQSERAQDTLWQMGPVEFIKFYKNTVARAKSPREVQYIYKALAAGNSPNIVIAFAGIIRNQTPEWMRNNLSLTNHTGGGGIKQQWHDSCNATTVQAARGQLDPVYAYLLIKKNSDITSANDSNATAINPQMAQEQKEMLEQGYTGSLGNMGGGTAVNRDATGGAGRWADDLLNEQTENNGVSFRTLRRGDGHSLTSLIAEIKKGAQRGIPVPIVVGDSPTSYGHYTMVTRMDSSTTPNLFFIHDPWEGIMKQFTEDDFKNSTLSLAGWTTLSAVDAVTEE